MNRRVQFRHREWAVGLGRSCASPVRPVTLLRGSWTSFFSAVIQSRPLFATQVSTFLCITYSCSFWSFWFFLFKLINACQVGEYPLSDYGCSWLFLSWLKILMVLWAFENLIVGIVFVGVIFCIQVFQLHFRGAVWQVFMGFSF